MLAASSQPEAAPAARAATTAPDVATAATQPSVPIDLSSPRATLETMHRASLAGDIEGYVRTLDPPLQRPIRTLLLSSRALAGKASSVAALVQRKIGKEQAAAVRKLAEDSTGLPSPLARAVQSGQPGQPGQPGLPGEVDWKRVTIDVTDDQATMVVGGEVLAIKLRRIDEKWYAIPPAAAGGDMTPQRIEEEMNKAAAINRKMADNLATFEQRVAAGQVTGDNFYRVFNGIVFGGAAGGPPR